MGHRWGTAGLALLTARMPRCPLPPLHRLHPGPAPSHPARAISGGVVASGEWIRAAPLIEEIPMWSVTGEEIERLYRRASLPPT